MTSFEQLREMARMDAYLRGYLSQSIRVALSDLENGKITLAMALLRMALENNNDNFAKYGLSNVSKREAV